jgi:hypothetical protein
MIMICFHRELLLNWIMQFKILVLFQSNPLTKFLSDAFDNLFLEEHFQTQIPFFDIELVTLGCYHCCLSKIKSLLSFSRFPILHVETQTMTGL